MAIDAVLAEEATIEEFRTFLTNEGLSTEEVKAAETELNKILEARNES